MNCAIRFVEPYADDGGCRLIRTTNQLAWIQGGREHISPAADEGYAQPLRDSDAGQRPREKSQEHDVLFARAYLTWWSQQTMAIDDASFSPQPINSHDSGQVCMTPGMERPMAAEDARYGGPEQALHNAVTAGAQLN